MRIHYLKLGTEKRAKGVECISSVEKNTTYIYYHKKNATKFDADEDRLKLDYISKPDRIYGLQRHYLTIASFIGSLKINVAVPVYLPTSIMRR